MKKIFITLIFVGVVMAFVLYKPSSWSEIKEGDTYELCLKKVGRPVDDTREGSFKVWRSGARVLVIKFKYREIKGEPDRRVESFYDTISFFNSADQIKESSD